MSVIISLVIVFSTIILTILNFLLISRKKKKVVPVIAGDARKDKSEQYDPFVSMSPINLYTKDGQRFDMKDYERVVVQGNCMARIGIPDGRQLLIHRIDPNTPFNKQIAKKDILLLEVEGEGKKEYKLRILDRYGDNGDLLTYRLDPITGQHIASEKPHKRENVIGVVKYEMDNENNMQLSQNRQRLDGIEKEMDILLQQLQQIKEEKEYDFPEDDPDKQAEMDKQCEEVFSKLEQVNQLMSELKPNLTRHIM